MDSSSERSGNRSYLDSTWTAGQLSWPECRRVGGATILLFSIRLLSCQAEIDL